MQVRTDRMYIRIVFLESTAYMSHIRSGGRKQFSWKWKKQGERSPVLNR